MLNGNDQRLEPAEDRLHADLQHRADDHEGQQAVGDAHEARPRRRDALGGERALRTEHQLIVDAHQDHRHRQHREHEDQQIEQLFDHCSATSSRPNFSGLLLSDLEHGEERFLRDLDLADVLHALLAFFLLLEQLLLARDVAAITLGEHVLAQRLDGRAGDDMAADGRLHGDLEHLPRNQFLHLVDQLPAAIVGAVLVDDERQRIDLLVVDQDVEFDQRRGFEVTEVIVERGVTAAGRFQAVEEIEHHFGERHLVLQRDLVAEEQHLLLAPALFVAQLQHATDVVGRHENVGNDDGFAQLVDAVDRRQLGRVVDERDLAVGLLHLVDRPSGRW